ncbi:MAG: peptidylprolyl isomerase [Chloroflexi bacterium]|nr:peptidylprolyl isomerase [Chloroflexota bacterium]
MTSNLRSRGGGSAQRRPLDPEERFQRRVTMAFIGLTIAVVAVIVIGVAWQFWDQHLRSVATVNGASISRDQWVDRAQLLSFRLDRADRRVTESVAAGDLTSDQALARRQAISTAQQSYASDAIFELVDLTYQGQLAAEQGITISDAELDAAVDAASMRPEMRRVSIIQVAPEVEDATGRQQALADARAAEAALAAGTDFATVAREYGTVTTATPDGDYGTITADDATLDRTLVVALFGLAEGQDTPLLQDEDGTYLIARLTAIEPPVMDPTFQDDLPVSWDAFRQNVRMETIAQRLEDSVVASATTGDQPQVHLAEIFLSGDTQSDPDADSGRVRAAHILISPEDDPGLASGGDLPDDDPSWTVAAAQAGLLANQLTAITDPATREAAFVRLAAEHSADTSNASSGGELGWFDRDRMVPEFADPLFDNLGTLQPGDIVGPVRSAFGYHLIRFEDYEPPLAQRRTDLETALAEPDVDFAALAMEMSDGAEGPTGGDIGWRTEAQVPLEAQAAVVALEPGGVTEPIETEDGWHVYQLIERADRPLDATQLVQVRASAFDDWYQPQRGELEEAGGISFDESMFG